MNGISFKLSGKTAHFRKPDVNSYFYLTYNNVHKIALFGLFGSVLGLKGYNQLSLDKKLLEEKRKLVGSKEKANLKEKLNTINQKFPEFYEKLCHLKISISPLSKFGYFNKKIQVFNNSVGYASKETGGNLIVREQWLENPAWQIIVLDDESKIFQKLKDNILNKKSVYIPYLGKNDHIAIIDEPEYIKLDNNLTYEDDEVYIDSLFPLKGDLGFHREKDENRYVFQEFSPIELQKDYQFYKYVKLVYTNCEPEIIPKNTYSYNGKNYSFI